MADYYIHQCAYCGEKTTGKFCKNCGTAAGRKEVLDKNIEIAKENIKKGIKIPQYLRKLI